MPLIEYGGYTPVVSVPTHCLADIQAGVPVEVSQEAADDLTLGGQSPTWTLVEEG